MRYRYTGSDPNPIVLPAARYIATDGPAKARYTSQDAHVKQPKWTQTDVDNA